MIEGIKIRPLKKFSDERGKVLKMLDCNDKEYNQFGEIYFSTVYKNKIKGWHLHTKMTITYAVISGKIKLVAYDNRENSPTKGMFNELIIGEDEYNLVQIPPQIWYGFKGISEKEAIVADFADLTHDPTEAKRLDPFNNDIIKYDWNK